MKSILLILGLTVFCSTQTIFAQSKPTAPIAKLVITFAESNISQFTLVELMIVVEGGVPKVLNALATITDETLYLDLTKADKIEGIKSFTVLKETQLKTTNLWIQPGVVEVIHQQDQYSAQLSLKRKDGK